MVNSPVSPLHPENALPQISVTEPGIINEPFPLNPLNALTGIRVTPLPIFIVALALLLLNTGSLELPMVVQFVALKLIVVSPLHPENAPPTMFVTLLPIVSDVMPLQPENAA